MIRAYDIVGQVVLSMTFCGMASPPIDTIMFSRRIHNVRMS